ncbi:MAG: nucleotidyltransferase family protein [Phycisphaeraceae bacterium]
MHEAIDQHREAIFELCRRFYVRRLDVFGSVTTDAFDPNRSDVDFLVEFWDDMPIRRFNAYFQLKDQLEQLLERKVDLIEPGGVRNDYYRRGIDSTLEHLYAA